MVEKILTKHPEGKAGVNISRAKYEAIKTAVTQSFDAHGAMTYTELAQDVRQRLGDSFEGSIRWHVEVVKLDLEARGIIERVPKTRPQKLRLMKTAGSPGS